jgi:hypothetical protein
MRTVKTTSGATAVQVVWSSRRGSREIEHLGSAHDEAELEALKAAAQQRIAAGQQELDLGLEHAGGGPLPITSSKMGHLVDALEHAYRVLGFEEAAGGDEVFRQLVLARIIEPVSKLDSLRVLEEAGVTPASYRTLKRRMPAYAEDGWRQRLSEACAAHARPGPASLVLYDVSTLLCRRRHKSVVTSYSTRDIRAGQGVREAQLRDPVPVAAVRAAGQGAAHGLVAGR